MYWEAGSMQFSVNEMFITHEICIAIAIVTSYIGSI